MTFAQLYIQECCPARYRGLMISTFQVWTSVGALVGTIVDNFTAPIAGRNSYLIPLGIVFVVPVIMSFGLLFIPESPRWLMQHGKAEKAKKALLWMRPYGESEAEEELGEIQWAMDRDAELNRSTGLKDLFANPVDSRRTVLAVCALTVQGASGAMYMIGMFYFLECGASPACSHRLFSLRYIFLLNGGHQECFPELCHSNYARCDRNSRQQRGHYAHRPAPSLPRIGSVHLRHNSTAHRSRLYNKPRE